VYGVTTQVYGWSVRPVRGPVLPLLPEPQNQCHCNL
jgi:hypothetical protein